MLTDARILQIEILACRAPEEHAELGAGALLLIDEVRALRVAVAAEREACAKVADEAAKKREDAETLAAMADDRFAGAIHGAAAKWEREIAAAIRARK